ncbi:hypothetical protein QBC45DRAFT_334782, partial [Copromyces sp. CBS 386.78]
YLKNRSPYSIFNKTLYELVFGQRPDVNNIRTINITAWHLILEANRKKIDEKAVKYTLIGFEGHTVYKLLIPNKRVIRLTNVHFKIETALIKRGIKDVVI